MSDDPREADRIAAIRRFNRFYTRAIGVLRDRLLRTPYSLAEVRVLYELANREGTAAGELARDLGLDAGYLSRILTKFERAGHLVRSTSRADGRRRQLELTPSGREVCEVMDAAQSADVSAMVAHLTPRERDRLVAAMAAIETLIVGDRPAQPFVLRSHEPGDLAWMAHRQAVLYNTEYGWDETFEALLCELSARFIRCFDPGWERAWVAETDGEIVGGIVCVRESDEVARLRMLYVERRARGLGLGRRLVDECIGFARRRGYRRMCLWTNDVLHAARRIYEAAGFVLVSEEQHRSFGKELTGQTWELELRPADSV